MTELTKLRRTPIPLPDRWPRELSEHSDLLEQALPHRPPMLLVDELVGCDLDAGLLMARRHIGDDHIGLTGHFPGDPMVPGTLLLEMLGQAGVVLYSLLLEDEIREGLPGVRATKILGAHFAAEVRPGDTVDLVVRAGEYDTFLGECVAQAIVDGDIACAMAGEVAIIG